VGVSIGLLRNLGFRLGAPTPLPITITIRRLIDIESSDTGRVGRLASERFLQPQNSCLVIDFLGGTGFLGDMYARKIRMLTNIPKQRVLHNCINTDIGVLVNTLNQLEMLCDQPLYGRLGGIHVEEPRKVTLH